MPESDGCVALRKESVDRNMSVTEYGLKWIVALRKESVDRNGRIMNVSNGLKRSLSARRAWIEIIGYSSVMLNTAPVALRKESVDRNAAWTGVLRDMHHASLSARRAWIEILKQRVDFEEEPRRSPQGERG